MDPNKQQKIEQMRRDLEVYRAQKNGGFNEPVQSTSTFQQQAPVSPATSKIKSDLEAYRAAKRSGGSMTAPAQKDKSAGGFGPLGLGRALDYTIRGKDNVRTIEQGVSDITKGQQELIRRIKERRARGEDVTHLLKGLQGSSDALAELGGSAVDAATGGMQTKDVIGSALETASLLPVGAAATAAKGMFGRQVLRSGIQGAGEGAVGGSLAFAGGGLKEASDDATTGELVEGAIGDAAKGAGIGAATGFGIGAAIPAVAKGGSALFRGAKQIGADVAESGSIKTAAQKKLGERYRNVEAKSFAQPGEIGGSKYRKPAEIYRNAKSKGNNIDQLAVDEGIRYDDLVQDGKLSTIDARDIVRDKAIKLQRDTLRPALETYKYSVQRVPVEDVRKQMVRKINAIPDSSATAADREKMLKIVNQQFGPGSAEARANPLGYDLVNLLDGKVARDAAGKYNPNGSAADNFTANLSRKQASVFRELLEKTAPKELDIKGFNKELANRFQLADYLESLDGKQAPKSVVQKTMQFVGKGAGAMAGTQAGGGLGGFAGYHIGGNLLDWFSNAPNPIKKAILDRMEVEAPAVFKAFEDAIGKENVRKVQQLLLPESKTIFAGSKKTKDATRLLSQEEAQAQLLPQVIQAEANKKYLPAPSARYVGPTQEGAPFTPNPGVNPNKLFRGGKEK